MKRFILIYVIIAGVVAILSFLMGEGEKSVEYSAGMFCGMVAAGAIVAFFGWVVRKLGGEFRMGCDKKSYDERQLLARGQAYKAAFFTLLGYVAIAGILDEIEVSSVLMSLSGMWIGACLSIVVFATICIVKDAYMSLYENTKGVIMMFSFVGILNLLVLIPTVVLEKVPLIENGVLASGCLNLMTGVVFLIIDIVFIAKVIYNGKYAQEDEE